MLERKDFYFITCYGIKTIFAGWNKLRTSVITSIWMGNIYNPEDYDYAKDPNPSIFHHVQHNYYVQTLMAANTIRSSSITTKAINLGIGYFVTGDLITPVIDIASSAIYQGSTYSFEVKYLNPLKSNIDAAYHTVQNGECPTEDQIASIVEFINNKDNITSEWLDKENWYSYFLPISIMVYQASILSAQMYKSINDRTVPSSDAVKSAVALISFLVDDVTNTATSGWKSVMMYEQVAPALLKSLEDQARYVLVKGGDCDSVTPEAKALLEIIGRDISGQLHEKIIHDHTIISEKGDPVDAAVKFIQNLTTEQKEEIMGQLKDGDNHDHQEL